MVAPLRKKNTLEQTGFALTESGFTYRGLNYDFVDVLETGIFRQRLETKTLFVGSTFTHAISIVFAMRDGSNVQVTEQPVILQWGSSRENKVNKIHKMFNFVSAKTFRQRFKTYADQVAADGFFDYGGWRFFPAEGKMIHLPSKKPFSTSSVDLLKGYGFLEVREKNQTLSDKLARRFGTSIGINTMKDTDVFFALLKHFFNKSWKQST